MNTQMLRYLIGFVIFALLVTVIVLAVLKLTKKNEGPGLISGRPSGYAMSDDPGIYADYAGPSMELQTPDLSNIITKSSFGSPNDLLEEEYLKTLNFVERLYHKTLSASDRQTRLAKFSISKPELLGNILDKFKNQ